MFPTQCSRRREEAEKADAPSLRLLAPAATIAGGRIRVQVPTGRDMRVLSEPVTFFIPQQYLQRSEGKEAVQVEPLLALLPTFPGAGRSRCVDQRVHFELIIDRRAPSGRTWRRKATDSLGRAT